VVFASDTVFAEAAAAALRRAGLDHVFDASRGQDVGDDFQACSGGAVAVFGPAGEEGLNLHFADAIVHADLPTSIGRLEQRIGRLDRFGRTRGPIKHVLIYPAAEDDTVWSAWTDLLRDGFGVFDRPVSDLQFVLDDIEVEVRRRMLLGPQDLLQFRETLAGRVAQHRERLDEQYAMDQLAVARDSARALADAFEDAEADEEDLQARVGALLASTLQFEVRHNGPDVFSLDWARNTQLPDRPWRNLFAPGLNRALTWKRRLSVARPQVSLLRPGSSLIEALERLLEWDDRGAAFATWRLQPGGGGVGEERLAFRLCWIVTPATPAAEMLRPGEDADGLRRQAEGFLQPWTLTQHIGPDLQPIEDADWLNILERPYQPETKGSDARDFNLGSRSEWLEQVIDRTSFAELCARTSCGAGISLSNSEAFRSRVAAATIQAQREMDRRAARRRLRADFDSSAASSRAAELDELVCELVAKPAIRLDCIGIFVVSGYVPHVARL
jgi:ATP-dependent helicase HepA